MKLNLDDPAELLALLDDLAAQANKLPGKWPAVAVALWQASSDVADAFVGPKDADTGDEPDLQERLGRV